MGTRFNSDWRGYDPEYADHQIYHTVAELNGKDGMPASANVGVGAYSVVILSQDE